MRISEGKFKNTDGTYIKNFTFIMKNGDMNTSGTYTQLSASSFEMVMGITR